MKDRLKELLHEIANMQLLGKSIEEGVEFLLANGVIVSPCKVGDKVWFLNKYSSIAMRKNAVYEAKVVRVYVEKGNILTLSIQVKNEWGTTEYPRITEIGKTVFLTKKEAEKALAERIKYEKI